MAVPSFPQINWRAAGTTSAPIELAGQTAVGFITPGTVASATCTFEVSDRMDGTYVGVEDSSGNAISFTIEANKYYGFTQNQIAAFLGVKCLRVVGASSEAAGTQWKLAAREIA